MNNIEKLSIITMVVTIIVPPILLFIIPSSRRFIVDEFFLDLTSFLCGIMFGFLYILIAIGISIIVVFPTLKAISLKTHTYTDTKKHHSEKNIRSLYLNSEPKLYQETINESFSLGVTVVNTDSYFYFFAEENGRYKLDKVNANETYIEETDVVEPKVISDEEKEVFISETNPTNIGKFLGLEQEITERVISEKTESIIYIPVGSIIENYSPNSNN